MNGTCAHNDCFVAALAFSHSLALTLSRSPALPLSRSLDRSLARSHSTSLPRSLPLHISHTRSVCVCVSPSLLPLTLLSPPRPPPSSLLPICLTFRLCPHCNQRRSKLRLVQRSILIAIECTKNILNLRMMSSFHWCCECGFFNQIIFSIRAFEDIIIPVGDHGLPAALTARFSLDFAT